MQDELFLQGLDKLTINGKLAKTHPAKLKVFSDFLNEVFDIQTDRLIGGIEKKVYSHIIGVRGSIDLLFSSVIFEFKIDLSKEYELGKKELIKYLQSAFEKGDKGGIGIMTDCIKYFAFLPVVDDRGVVIDLREFSQLDLTTSDPNDALLWFDAYLFSKNDIKPTAKDLNIRFGPSSPTYSIIIKELEELYEEIKDESETNLKLELWYKNLSIVYGQQPKLPSFLDHTYLVTLVKLIVYNRVKEGLPDDDIISDVINGSYFRSFGIMNLIEEDYFSWILHERILNRVTKICKSLLNELFYYNFLEIGEDLFREIYQYIVNPSERHRTGEFYTPDWLSKIVLDETISYWNINKKGIPRILDPACGSGTFITNSIKIFKGKLLENKSPEEVLESLLTNVCGMDINPIAVTISRANYLLILRELLSERKEITIPIFLSDSIRIPVITKTVLAEQEVYEINFHGNHFQFPQRLFRDKLVFNQVISILSNSLGFYSEKRDLSKSNSILNSLLNFVNDEEFQIIRRTYELIIDLINKDLNSVWIFILSNLYAPIFFKEKKFDIIVGNPPWLVLRNLENKEYQGYIKKEIFQYGLLSNKDIKLFTHMELATLFFCKTSDLYLKDEGYISFLMPISTITGTLQHSNFRKFANPPLKLVHILNFEKIRGIFSLPVCVLIAKKGENTSYPVNMTIYSFNQPSQQNPNNSDVTSSLNVLDVLYDNPFSPEIITYSKYYDKFKEGPTISPRPLWFIDFKPHKFFGIDKDKPSVKSSEDVLRFTKKRWKNIELEGRVEKEYVFHTILGKDLIPFGYVQLRAVIIPMEVAADKHILLTVDNLRKKGAIHTASWVERNQDYWIDKRTESSELNYPLITDRLNHNNYLISQNPSKQYVVIYNARGANAMCCVVDKNYLKQPSKYKSPIQPTHFTADSTNFFYETNNLHEAHYLCAILNSRITNKKVKSFQPKGDYGHRDIGRRPLMLSIPEFNENIDNHRELVMLSIECHSKIQKHQFEKTTFKSMRNECLKILKDELDKIDQIVIKLIK